MKKTSFFYLLMAGLIIFTACKDPVEPKPTTTGLESKSFIVEQLKDSVAGNYADYVKSENSLKCSYIVRNKTNATIQYNVSIAKLQFEPSHWITHCIGSCILPTQMSYFADLWDPGNSTDLVPGGQTNPEMDSYIEMWSGESSLTCKPGINKLKVTYTNAKDPTDFVYFTLTFNFFE